jgi:endonuclease I
VVKNYTLLLLLTFSGFLSIGQGIPPGYYNAATGLSCQSLKDALSNIISTGQVTLVYGQLDNNQMPIVDTIRSDDGTSSILWDIYSNNNAGPEPYTFNSSQVNPGGFCGSSTPTVDGTCWNKEHTFPKAWFASAYPTYADLFVVRPTDYRLNAKRGNAPYATVSSPTYQFPVNGVYPGYPIPPNPVLDKLGPSSTPGVTIPVAWEPSDAIKGDLARGYFYILTRYQSNLGAWVTANTGTGIEKVVDAANSLYPSFNLPYLKMMYDWHIADPVDAKEINRNNLIYTQQNNRNPYIDHPEYVFQVWQCTGVIPVTITDFTAVKHTESVLLNWNATYETNFKQYDIERSIDGTNFYKIGEIAGRNLSNYSFNDDHLPNGSIAYYRLKMIDIDGKFKYSKIIAVRLNNNFSNALVYPNPTTGKLTIKLLEALESNSILVVTDITGRNVKQQNIVSSQLSISLDVKTLPDGRYFIKIYNSTQMINQSFVIIK